MGQVIDNLRAEIRKLYRESLDKSGSTDHPERRYFVNVEALKTLFTREIIAEAIKECNVKDYERPAVANRIFTEGKVVFGILIWRKWHRKLQSFIEHNTLDKQLPLDEEQAKAIAGTSGFGLEFARKAQWEFLPRILTKEMSGYHCHFRDEEVFPFVAETELGEGTFGEVTKISVMPSLQTIFPKSMFEVYIVKKRLKQDAEDAEMYMEREKECLRTLDHLRHPNIVRLLSSYTHRGNHCFLFPLFDMDLARFLQLKQRFGDFEKDFTFYTALQGLSSALVKVHSLNLNTRDHDTELERIGYHHDIRPANILVDSRTFYLADFGLAKMKPGDAKSETDWITGLGDYVGPECRNEQDLQRSRVGRPLDIWSFGCMLSEVAANIKGGADGVEKFRKIREGPAARRGMSDTYFFAGGKLRESVITWFEKSKAHDQSRSGALSGLLEVASLMLKIEPRNRPKASEVHEKLAFLSVKALFDAVQETFTEYLGKAKLQQSDKRTSMTAIQLEIRRLNAWGKVLQLSRNSPLADVDVDVVRTVSQNGDCFRGLLISSLKKLDEYKTIAKAGGAGPSPPAFAFSIHKPLHEGLRELTTALWNSVPTQQLDKLEHEWLQDSLDTDSPETLREIQSGAQSFTHQYTELSAFTLAKRENLLLKSPDIQGTERESLLLDSGVHVEKSFGDYQVGRYEGKQVWIERVFDPPEFEAMPELKRRLRIQRLAEVRSLTPKPTGFCVLDCLFAIPDQKHYDFVYAFPTPQSESPTVPKPTVPTSLSKILEKPRKDVNLSLRESFQLAHKLVNCVWALHTSRWVHKNICSTNVIFFQEGSSALSEELKNPYIVGFRDSRPSEEEWHTKPHAKGSILQHSQHPDYSANDQHFRGIYDYYSIGIVLLELGSWAQLEYILRKTPRESKGPAAFRDLLIEKYVPRLSYTMGDTYRDATLACLECSFGSGGVDEDTALRGFYNRVVGPLHQLSGFPI